MPKKKKKKQIDLYYKFWTKCIIRVYCSIWFHAPFQPSSFPMPHLCKESFRLLVKISTFFSSHLSLSFYVSELGEREPAGGRGWNLNNVKSSTLRCISLNPGHEMKMIFLWGLGSKLYVLEVNVNIIKKNSREISTLTSNMRNWFSFKWDIHVLIWCDQLHMLLISCHPCIKYLSWNW